MAEVIGFDSRTSLNFFQALFLLFVKFMCS